MKDWVSQRQFELNDKGVEWVKENHNDSAEKALSYTLDTYGRTNGKFVIGEFVNILLPKRVEVQGTLKKITLLCGAESATFTVCVKERGHFWYIIVTDECYLQSTNLMLPVDVWKKDEVY